jgi:Sporulation protein YtfJ (Spore_YtfJ)
MERTQTGTGLPSQDWMEHLQASLGADRVFGTPVESGGSLIIPVASVRGGGGGGSGVDAEGKASGQNAGAGFGLSARPAGVFVVRDGRVAWRPAVDANRVLLGVQLLLAMAFWVGMARRRAPPRPSSRELQRRLLRRALVRRLLKDFHGGFSRNGR